jgi:glyoxylase-like metal-dependent hydrolase (beta-lactamase superfamily II)
MDDRRVIHQLRAGRDFARTDPVAAQMANFAYLIGDKVDRTCLIVDPAWDVDGLVAAAHTRGLRPVGALITHYHPDHCGGSMMGFRVQGLTRLLEIAPCPIHCHRAETHGIKVVTGLSDGDLTAHDSGDRVKVGEVEVELLHTPGHTPGSQCFRCGDALVSGDTLFLQGCGRVDLPGGDRDEMFRTVQTRLSTLPDDLTLYPGHDYGSRPSDTLGAVKRTNAIFRPQSLADWRRMMG